jgi:hypothetical protein
MAALERVIFVFGYYNGPTKGVSVGPDGAKYFRSLFRDDLDEYDDVFSVMELDEADRQEFEWLFRDARLTDPACRDPARRALSGRLAKKFNDLLESDSPKIRRLLPKFYTKTGGAYGEYEVEWLSTGS